MNNPTYTDEQVRLLTKEVWDRCGCVVGEVIDSLLADRQRLQAQCEAEAVVAGSYFDQIKELQAQVEVLRKDAAILQGGIFIGGPRATAVVFSRLHVEAVVDALCAITGDDESDYTATPLDENARATPNETKEAKS